MSTPDLSGFACEDCASTVRIAWPAQRVMDVLVDHSPTCPAWPEQQPELAVRFLPKGLTEEQIERWLGPFREQGERR